MFFLLCKRCVFGCIFSQSLYWLSLLSDIFCHNILSVLYKYLVLLLFILLKLVKMPYDQFCMNPGKNGRLGYKKG
ncbi:hypothetical protein Hanom_Chr11g00985331 [Helianthus anomalus]